MSKNNIIENHGDLICELAYDMAKDEVFRDNLFVDESELIIIDSLGNTSYNEEFQPIFDRWYDYFFSMFETYIK